MKNILQLSLFKTILFLLCSLFVLRLSFSLIIFYWNVPQTDDFCFMARMQEYGIWGSIKWWYFNWQGRYLPQILTNFVLYQYKIFDNMILYGFLISILFIFSTYQFIQYLFKNSGLKLETKEKFIIGLFSGILFCLILDFHSDTSTFYWINVSAMYYTGIAFFILGISELLNLNKKKISKIIVSFSFIYVGCSAEHVGLLVLGFLIIFYILQNHLKGLGIYYFNPKKLNLAILSCLVSFLIMYFAPGNAVRLSGTTQPSISEGLKHIVKFSNIFYFNRLSENAGYLVFVFLFSICLGGYFKDRINYDQLRLQKLLFTGLLTLVYFTVGTIVIFSFLVDYNPPSRAFVHISTLFVLFFALFGCIIGLISNPKQASFLNQMVLIAVLIYGTTIIYKFRFNLKPSVNYALSVRKRLSDIQVQKENTGKYLIIPPLYNSPKNILLDGEIASSENDTNLFWANKCLNTAYGLPDKQIILIDSLQKSNQLK